MHTLIEKFYPSFDRGISNLTSASQQELLQQKKMNIHEGKTRNLRTGHLIETKPVFHLDEDGVEQPRHIVEAISERSHQPLDSEYVESIRDLYINRRREYNQKKPLPPIGKQMIISSPLFHKSCIILVDRMVKVDVNIDRMVLKGPWCLHYLGYFSLLFFFAVK